MDLFSEFDLLPNSIDAVSSILFGRKTKRFLCIQFHLNWKHLSSMYLKQFQTKIFQLTWNELKSDLHCLSDSNSINSQLILGNMNGTADGTVNHVKCFPGTIPTGVFLGYHHTQMNLMSFSLMIIYHLLCSPTYVHLCKCLIWCEIKKH